MNVVVVGAALAGARAATALREEGHEGPITLVGAEPHPPYERPPLSKGYLMGKEELDGAFVHPEAWYAEHDVTLRLRTRATAIDRDARRVRLDDGEDLPYDRLLLTTGAVPRPLSVPGAEELAPHYLRTIEDSQALKAAFVPGARVVVVGGGWIGLEAAAAARNAGSDVVVLEYAELPLLRVLGPEMAEVFAGLHREQGVDLRSGVRIASARAGALVLPTPTTRTTAGICGSSTGRTRWSSRRSPPWRCSTARPATSGCRTSSATSTTSAWSTPGTSRPAATTGSSSAATSPAASSSPSGPPAAGCSPG
jgi:3-phenylpropionate/trans-cinnamate dioxygenase ferredoxin reductase subunit